MEKTLFENFKATIYHYRLEYAKAFLMVLLSNTLLIVNPLIFRHAVDSLSGNFYSENRSLKIQLLGSWILLLLCTALISAYFKYKMRIKFISLSREAEQEVRSEIFVKLQEQSSAFYDNHGIGELLSRLTNDISTYRDVLGPGILYPLYCATLVIPGVIGLFYISPALASIALVPLILIPLVNALMRKKIYTLSLSVQEYLGYLSNIVQEHFSGIRIIKGFVIENSTLNLFQKMSLKLSELNLKLMWSQGLIFPFFSLMTKVVTILLVFFSGVIILKKWGGGLNAADFVSFMWIQSYVFMPLLMLAWVLPMYERGRAAYDRLYEIYHEPVEVKKTSSNENFVISPNSDIVIKNLSFKYPKSTLPALNNLTMHIKGGSFVGITGQVGSGKSTLFRLLNRNYEIPESVIFFEGRDIHRYNHSALTNAIVNVEQAPFLFSKTISENVSFGKEEATQEEIESMADFADLHSSILEFPDKYKTVIGERGVTLSGGQKQRLAIARAFLVDRSILLLDDVFSAIDFATEQRIFETMKKNFEGKTVVLITHKVSILEKMDYVYYLQKGSVVEEGSPKDLFKKNGLYRALKELQTLSEHV